jgi:hypothetical protein
MSDFSLARVESHPARDYARRVYNVYHKGGTVPVAQIVREQGNHTIVYKNKVIQNSVHGCWTRETIQQLLFIIKGEIDNDYTQIDYEIIE